MVKPNDVIALVILFHIIICILMSICLYRFFKGLRNPPGSIGYKSSGYSSSRIGIEDDPEPGPQPGGRIHVGQVPGGNVNVRSPGSQGRGRGMDARPPPPPPPPPPGGGRGNVNVRPGSGRGAVNVRPGGFGVVNLRPVGDGGGAVHVRH
ncbi:hypothetical protein EG329_001276 [Mollisiaceae sp. DMI_Dod_QoI]|nr:hypothetical protein EG329_001276 [Helotiales sp. DMI_Dod_QoI]